MPPGQAPPPQSTRAQRIHAFFEQPSSRAAKAVQALIYVLILCSTGIAVAEIAFPEVYNRYKELLWYADHAILGVFVAEYALKVATAPNRLRFALPFLFESTEVRTLRLLRLLRGARLIRVFRFLWIEFFSKLFRFQKTVLQAILPIMLVLAALKGLVWGLEALGFWVFHSNLGELFAIVGFALGIILSQKVAATYDKFLQVEDQVMRMTASLSGLADILDAAKPGSGRYAHEWARAFLHALRDPAGGFDGVSKAGQALHNSLAAIESQPGDLAMKYLELQENAAYCLGRSKRLTPRPYDSLLQQATVMYLVLLAAFIPGWSGFLSVVVASYVLYGMYYLTQDLDSILGGEFRLISIDIHDMERFATRGPARS
jgi:hypothetical protein